MHRLIIYYTPKWKNLLRLRATQNALQLLFFLSLFSALFWTDYQSFLANVVRSVTLEACDEDLTHFLDTPKNICVKVVPEIVIRDVCGT